MICVSVAEPDFSMSLELVRQFPFVELRLDAADFTLEQVQQLVQAATRCIVTFRPGKHGDNYRSASMKAAIEAGASMIDLELDSPPGYRDNLMRVAKKNQCGVIISYHNFTETPGTDDLDRVFDRCTEQQGDVVKIACMVNESEDNLRLIDLHRKNGKKVIISMGEKGRFARIAGLYLGSEFTFASPSNMRDTAPGQYSYHDLQKIIQLINQE